MGCYVIVIYKNENITIWIFEAVTFSVLCVWIWSFYAFFSLTVGFVVHITCWLYLINCSNRWIRIMVLKYKGYQILYILRIVVDLEQQHKI